MSEQLFEEQGKVVQKAFKKAQAKRPLTFKISCSKCPEVWEGESHHAHMVDFVIEHQVKHA